MDYVKPVDVASAMVDTGRRKLGLSPADLLIRGRQFAVAWREGAGRTLAVHPHTLANAVDIVLLGLGDVVGHVVNQIHA